jgi:integrase
MRKQRSAWNKGRLLGQKPPLKPKEIWSLRIRLQLADKARDLALFNLAVAYGTHSLRRTKATLIYKRTKNIRAIQLLLGHTKLESTVRYLGIEVDDALEISEQTEI